MILRGCESGSAFPHPLLARSPHALGKRIFPRPSPLLSLFFIIPMFNSCLVNARVSKSFWEVIFTAKSTAKHLFSSFMKILVGLCCNGLIASGFHKSVPGQTRKCLGWSFDMVYLYWDSFNKSLELKQNTCNYVKY